jgi:hypothetical protein
LQAPLESLTFSALSYVWGDPKNTADIIVDGKPFQVTTNLEAFLKKTAADLSNSPSASISDGYLWVDAVCVDQKNIEERHSQVQRMGSIYSLAKQVIIWLGHGGDHARVGMDRMKELAKVTLQLGGPKGFTDPAKRATVGSLLRDTINDKESDEWKGMLEFFECPWWTRTWILQELALAKRALFVCGQETITFDEVYHTILHFYLDAMNDPLQALKNLNLSIEERDRVSLVMTIVNTRALYEHNYPDRQQSTRLQALLQKTQRSKATDPRDRVYGLLGMVSDLQKGGISPRYDLPVRQTYIETVRWHLENYQSLSILGQCFSDEPADKLHMPSWVPNWEPKEGKSEGPIPFHWEDYEDLTAKAILTPYHASGDMPLSPDHWEIDKTSGTFSLTGAHLGTIKFLSGPARIFTSTVEDDAFTIAKDWLELSTELGKAYPFTGESSNLALRRTMVADFYDRMVVLPEGVKHKQRGFALMLPDDPPLNINGTKWDYKDSMLTFINTVNKRRIAVSSEGWVGLVPSSAKVGDEIVVFTGGPVLYIVRERVKVDHILTTPALGQQYIFIGEAYFHGFMDGKAMEGRDLTNIVLV